MGSITVCNLRRIVLLLFLFVALVGCSRQANAGAAPRPLEVELDLAESVVVGRITNISPIPPRQPYEERGRATISVSRTLKGKPGKTIEVACTTKVSEGYGGAYAIPIHRAGDAGIWIIYSNGELSAWYGLLPDTQEPTVKQILQQLPTRKWSAPVNGLSAWASVVRVGYKSYPVVIFAVKNVSEKDIFVPRETIEGIVTATAEADGKEFRDPSGSAVPATRKVFTLKLAPGGIMYLHPRYSYIDVKRALNLPNGRYSVVVTCENVQEQGETYRVDTLRAWTGRLSSPAVEFTVEPEEGK